MPAGLHRSSRITPMPLGALPQQEEQRERRGRSRDALQLLLRASHARPKMPVTTPSGPAATRGVTLGLWPVRRDVRGAGGGQQVDCGGATSSHWDMAGTGSLLQLSPLQIPASGP